MPREIEPAVQMKLYTLTKRRLAMVFITFLVCFSLSVITGLAGPQVIYSDKHREKVIKNEYNAILFSVSTSLPLNSLNQQLWLIAKPVPHLGSDANSTHIEGSIVPKIHIFYSDTEGHEQEVDKSEPPKDHPRHILCDHQTCNSLLLMHLGYIDKTSYTVTADLKNLDKVANFEYIDFEFKTYKSTFTQLEIWFRVFFLVLTFIVTICYTRSLRPYHWKDWSIEQKWVMALLPLLLLYNNPLFALAFIVASFTPYVVDGLFQASFLSALLLFWICIYHSMREPKRTFVKFYLPKLVLVGLIWLAAVVLSTWQAVNERTDPAFNYKVDTVNFLGFKVLLFVFAAFYTLFLLYLLIRAFIELRNVAYFDIRLKFAAVFMVVVFSISLAILTLRFGTHVLDENFVSDISTRYGSAAEFLSFYGLLNFYIYTIAYVYSPSKNALLESRLHDNPVMTMLNESDDDVMYAGSHKRSSHTRESHSSSTHHFINRFDVDSD